MITTGVDLLITVVLFLLLVIILETTNLYFDWLDWDRDRRRNRKEIRYEYQDFLIETEYRRHLRQLNSPGLISAAHRITRSLEKFNKALRGDYYEHLEN